MSSEGRLSNNEVMLGIVRAAMEINVPLGSIQCLKDNISGRELVQWRFAFGEEVATVQYPLTAIPNEPDQWLYVARMNISRMIMAKKDELKKLDN